MELHVKPVFYSPDSSRWKRFLWLVKIVTVLLLFGIGAILISLFHRQVFKLPSLREHLALSAAEHQKYATADITAKETAHFIKLAKKTRAHKGHDFYKKDTIIPGETKKYELVRAAFYVNWDIQSKFSLNQNASKLNMVLPQWLFVQDTSEEIATEIDQSALDIMRRNHIAVVPMLSNYFNNKFNGDNVHRIITSPKRHAALIGSLLKVMERYRFNGVNIDFEDLNQEKMDEYLIAFQKELYTALHEKGYLVTQDIAPFNEDYNLDELAEYNDFISLMVISIMAFRFDGEKLGLCNAGNLFLQRILYRQVLW
jgi:spore germination protein YaaH